MGKESSLTWAPIQKALKELHWDHQRIEDRAASGIPDANVHIPGIGDVWMELKYAEPEAGGSIDIGLEREQFIWLRQGKLSGRSCLLVARIGNKWIAWDSIDAWFDAKHISNWSKLKTQAFAQEGSPHLLLMAIQRHLRRAFAT